jgi:hypothetical protein
MPGLLGCWYEEVTRDDGGTGAVVDICDYGFAWLGVIAAACFVAVMIWIVVQAWKDGGRDAEAMRTDEGEAPS